MWIDIEKVAEPKLRSPVLVVAVSTSMPQYKALYSQARELGKYLLGELSFKEVARVRSSAFPPEVIVREDGISSLPACRFYYLKGDRDLVLFCGDASPMDSQFEFSEAVLSYAEGLGVKELVSIGARWADQPLPPEAEPEVKGFATDKDGVEKLKSHGVKIISDEPAPFFASLVVALAGSRGIRGYKLSVDHGEPSPHLRSVRKLLRALDGITGVRLPPGPGGSPETDPGRKGSDPGIYQ